MITSVVITTYNGALYIEELLESLMKQSRPIDEVLIFDDKSNDDTVNIVNDFIRKFSLSNWKLRVNPENLGWEKNFIQGLQAAKGDIIFPCDQDDIWHLDKVEKMAHAFETNPNIGLLVSGYHAFNQNGGKVPVQQQVSTVGKELVSKVIFDEHYYCNLRPGCTMALKNDLIDTMVKNWRVGTPHDSLLWIIAILLDQLYLYNDILIEFRRHEINTSNGISHGFRYKVNECTRTLIVNEWYVKECNIDGRKINTIKNCNRWCELRYNLLVEKKLLNWFLLFKYRKYYLNIKKYIGDLYYFLKNEKKDEKLDLESEENEVNNK